MLGGIVPRVTEGERPSAGKWNSMADAAASYMTAMHGLCVKCHEEKVEQDPGQFQPAFAQCASCHGAALNFDLHEQGPYAPRSDRSNAERTVASSISGESAR